MNLASLKGELVGMGVVENKTKAHLYTFLTTASLLNGIYRNDEEIIICSLLVLSLCGMFIMHLKED